MVYSKNDLTSIFVQNENNTFSTEALFQCLAKRTGATLHINQRVITPSFIIPETRIIAWRQTEQDQIEFMARFFWTTRY